MSTARHSCAKLSLPLHSPQQQSSSFIFLKATWHSANFSLSVTDGNEAWMCDATEEEVRLRAEQWDMNAVEYISLVEMYLGFQQENSSYRFEELGAQRRLSFTFEREGMKLEWRWKLQPAPNAKKTTSEILDFLMDANIRLSDEVVRKTQTFEKLKLEAEKCLKQSERFKNEKSEFESSVYNKFVVVLNSKKAKLRELRDRIAKLESKGKAPIEEEKDEEEMESDNNTVLYEGTDEEKNMQIDSENEGETK